MDNRMLEMKYNEYILRHFTCSTYTCIRYKEFSNFSEARFFFYEQIFAGKLTYFFISLFNLGKIKFYYSV